MTDLDLLEDLLRLAARAPSPHNTQPWQPWIDGDSIIVAIVPSRTLPAGDPTFRDVILSLGAWVECAAVAAAAAGRALVVETLPTLDSLDELPLDGPADPQRPVLRVRLGGSGSSPFTADDVRGRAVFRGELEADPHAFADLGDATLPPWLSLRPVDPQLMNGLSRLGLAHTAANRPIAAEMLHWLRLSPDHPDYDRDGLNDRVLLLPRPLARLLAPLTGVSPLRPPVLAVAGVLGRVTQTLLRSSPLRGTPGRLPGTHHALIANARLAGAADILSRTEALDSRIGLPAGQVLEAGRAMLRTWLLAHRNGVAVSPHSEIIDSPQAYGILRRRLGLGRADVVLAVFSAGRPAGEVPRAPRRMSVG